MLATIGRKDVGRRNESSGSLFVVASVVFPHLEPAPVGRSDDSTDPVGAKGEDILRRLDSKRAVDKQKAGADDYHVITRPCIFAATMCIAFGPRYPTARTRSHTFPTFQMFLHGRCQMGCSTLTLQSFPWPVQTRRFSEWADKTCSTRPINEGSCASMYGALHVEFSTCLVVFALCFQAQM